MKKKYDNTIYPYSKISRLPLFLSTPALIFRYLTSRRPKYLREFDGIATLHNLTYLQDPRFKYSLEKAILVGGFDYQIYMRQHQAIWCADNALRLNKSGSFVELGTAKGYMMTTILSSLDYLGKDLSNLPVFLFDSFSSNATDNKHSQDDTFGRNIYYAESYEQVKNNFKYFTSVKLIQGLLPETLETIELGDISFLHIDLNAPEIEILPFNLVFRSLCWPAWFSQPDIRIQIERIIGNTTRIFFIAGLLLGANLRIGGYSLLIS